MIGLVAGGVFLALHPIVTVPASDFVSSPAGHPYFSIQCSSPFDSLIPGPRHGVQYSTLAYQRAIDAACSAATNGRQHIAEALGGGAVILLGLSFLPRRRAPATERRLEPSPV